jgi:S1-C subfamily serine protease
LDLAIIKVKVENLLVPAKIVKIQDSVKIWQIVFALKKDTDIKETIIKMWIINSKNQKFKIEKNNIYVGLLKTSTAIEPWFSWWPLVDLNWEIIWINTAIDNIEYWASYSLPINQEFINQTIFSIKESWKIIRPYIGIKYEDSPIWIKITEVIPGLNWDIAWLKVNDIIYGINNTDVNYNNFLYQLYTFKINKEIILNIQRGNHKEEIQISLWTESELDNKQ